MLSGWAASGNSLASIVWFSGTLLGIGGAAALLLPKIPAAPTLSNHLSRSTTRDWASLLQIPTFRLLLIIAALVEGSHALHNSFSVIRWRAAGAGLPVISALWSESVLSEVLVFLLIGPRLIRLFAPGGAIALAAVAGVIRWTVAAFTTSPVILAFIQPLHGFTFALLHLAAMQVIVQVVPLRLAATAQAIYGTLCIGLATAVLTLVSGLLYGWMGGPAFLVMAALCLLALPYVRSVALTGYSCVIPAARSDSRLGCIADLFPALAWRLDRSAALPRPRRRRPPSGASSLSHAVEPPHQNWGLACQSIDLSHCTRQRLVYFFCATERERLRAIIVRPSSGFHGLHRQRSHGGTVNDSPRTEGCR